MVKALLFSVWLIPSNPAHDVISAQIEHLSTTYNAPTFKPHMTLFSGASDDIEKTRRQFRELFTKQKAITLQAESIKHENFLYKSLFIQFKATPELTRLNQTTKSELDSSSKYPLNPHASLMYKQLPEAKKAQLANATWDNIKDNIKSVTFDQVMLTTDTEEVSEAAVNQWQVLETVRLKTSQENHTPSVDKTEQTE